MQGEIEKYVEENFVGLSDIIDDEALVKFYKELIKEAILEFRNKREPIISDDFQIGHQGAFEHGLDENTIEAAQKFAEWMTFQDSYLGFIAGAKWAKNL
jgi:hypothetical protein